MMSSSSCIRPLSVIAITIILSCTVAPKTSDVAHLEYGDVQSQVIDKYGQGIQVVLFEIDGTQYELRRYRTRHTEDQYILLFADNHLTAVAKDTRIDDCFYLSTSQQNRECFRAEVNALRDGFETIDLNTYDFSSELEAQRRELEKGIHPVRAVVSIPFFVACAGPVIHHGSTAAKCRNDYNDARDMVMALYHGQSGNTAIGKFNSVSEARGLPGNIVELHSNYLVYKRILHCNISDFIDYEATLMAGLRNKRLVWVSYSEDSEIPESAYSEGCSGTWSEVKRCASERNEAQRLRKEIGIYCPNADLGHADAQAHIGDLYYSSILERNLIQAFVWYSLAANNGYSHAVKRLENVIIELSQVQLLEAERRLKQWEPGQCRRDLMNAISEKLK